MTLLTKLRERGCIHDVSDFAQLETALEKTSLTFYCGFDPTANSLHVGSMLPLVMMRRLQRAGHTPIVVLGGATGMIGDPSGKSEERNLLDAKTIEENLAGIQPQISLFLDAKGKNAFSIVRNNEWLGKISFIEFLRDVGKMFSVNMMLNKESVRARIESREQGMSYTEFSYMLLQAYDFYHLHEKHKCVLQVGGSDQWGNITAGIDLIKKKHPGENAAVFGLTFPLLTTSTGAKFGKTAEGAVWLDKNRTSPYQFYQYWYNTADDDVLRYLRLFTDVTEDTIDELTVLVKEKPDERKAQRVLAEDLTTLVHGADETKRALEASSVLFGGSMDNLDSKTLSAIFSDVPSTQMPKADLTNGIELQELLVTTKLAQSKGAARRLIEGGGVYVNNNRAADPAQKIALNQFKDASVLILRSGKKTYHLVRAL